MKRTLPILILLIIILAITVIPAHAQVDTPQDIPSDTIQVFFSAGCADCWPYTNDVLLPALKANGITASSEIHDYTIPAERQRMSAMIDAD